MLHYVVRRLLTMFPILFIVSLVSFFLMYLAPGDPVTALLDQGSAASQELVEYMRAELGLDQPLYLQYFDWLMGVVRGDLGTSIVSGRPVLVEIASRLPATCFLSFVAMILTLIIAIPLGMVLARKQGRLIDLAVRGLCFVGSATPGFLMAMLLVYVFAIRLHWFSSLGSLDGSNWVLPVATLVACELPVYIRQVRSCVVHELAQDYVVAERVRGIAPFSTLVRSVLPAIAPTLLVFCGTTLGQLLGGTAVIEMVFSWPGVGSFAVREVLARDYPVIQGYVLLMALVYLVISLLVDLLQVAIDPRARLTLAQQHASCSTRGRLTRVQPCAPHSKRAQHGS